MEQDQNTSLFGLNIDAPARSFLSESAKWGKFLAIIGFIFCVLFIIVGIYLATTYSEMSRTFGSYRSETYMKGIGVVQAVTCIILAVVYFFPCLYLLRFANHMKAALASDDQGNLTASFQNLKSMFKFVGILTIIILAFYLFVLIIGGLSAAFM